MGFFDRSSKQPSRGAADRAKEAQKSGKIAKGKSSQVVTRTNPETGKRYEDKRQ